MRLNLKLFRIKNGLTQTEMSEKLGTTTATYSRIEKGERSGKLEFWNTLQTVFDIPDEEMWKLQKSNE